MKDEPSIILRRTTHGLEALNRVDADALEAFPLGSDVEVTFKKRRSSAQARLYWAILGEVVEATGLWPTAKHMHRELKRALGYTDQIENKFTGAVEYYDDSTAFSRMDGVAFKLYFDQAMKLIAETCGFDPLEAYEHLKGKGE